MFLEFFELISYHDMSYSTVVHSMDITLMFAICAGIVHYPLEIIEKNGLISVKRTT